VADAFVGVTAAQVLLSDPPSVKLAYLDHTSEIDVAGIVFRLPGNYYLINSLRAKSF
jgi:hypothetical protein